MADVNSSVNLTADATACARPAVLKQVVLTGGSDAATATIRNGGASGTIIAVLKVALATSQGFAFNRKCDTDIHVTLAGTAPNCYVEWN